MVECTGEQLRPAAQALGSAEKDVRPGVRLRCRTCASWIMATSLAPSPIASVTGLPSTPFFTSLTSTHPARQPSSTVSVVSAAGRRGVEVLRPYLTIMRF